MYDVAVLGLGGMGSATLAQLARRRTRVVGFERHCRGHALGSSAGRSRIIRKAYFEGSAYVPLLARAYDLWRDLEATSGATLLDLRGVLFVGAEASALRRGVLASAAAHDLAVERLDRAALLERYPSLLVREDEVGLVETDAGVVFPERAIAAHLAAAERAGAETRFETRVTGYASRSDGIHVTLADGSTVVAERLAICAGPWLGEVARDLGCPLRVERNVQIWFRPTTQAYAAARFPVFFVDRPAAYPAPLYGFPDYGDGVKAAFHGSGETTAADLLDRGVYERDVAPVRAALDGWMPGAAGAFAAGKACMYTWTPDGDFLIDTHPADPRIVVAGGFSGHGFKFCSVVGEIVADLALEGTTRHDIGFLRTARFGLVAPNG